ncbi:MAG: hypothetical protein IIB36_13235, partial [Gemmatimonadetes bacterium]|nr:hypothetical protein [Gemmatimonadota bacterium]
MIPDDLKYSLMTQTIEEAKLSQSEDNRIHPFVGAILCSSTGQELHRAHRGEILGAHAEFALLEKARQAGTQLEG